MTPDEEMISEMVGAIYLALQTGLSEEGAELANDCLRSFAKERGPSLTADLLKALANTSSQSMKKCG
jgi:hypothetical protein